MTRWIIGYVSESNLFIDRKVWSGTIYKIREAIENAGYTVIWMLNSSEQCNRLEQRWYIK